MLSFLYIRSFWAQLFFGLLLAVTTGLSQSAWRHIGVDDGLAQGYVGEIMQDSRGFIWFGTGDGLSRYDGYTFKNFRNDPGDSTTISTGIIFALHECKSSGLIWVGFLPGNIDIFDPSTEQFFHLREIQWTPTIVPHLFSIAEDTAGTHWVGRFGEFLEIKQTSKQQSNIRRASFQVTSHKEFQPYSGKQEHKETPDVDNVLTYADHSGGIWVWSNEKAHVINRLLQKPPEFQPGAYRLRMNHGGEIVEDRQGMLWFSISDSVKNYIYMYNPVTCITKRIFFQDALFQYEAQPRLVIDGHGNILLIGHQTPVKIDTRNPDRQEIIKAPYQIDVSSAIMDRGGILWVGSTGLGAERYNPAIERFGVLPQKLFLDLTKETVDKIGFPVLYKTINEITPYSSLYEYSVFRDNKGGEWYPSFSNFYRLTEALYYNPTTHSTEKFIGQKIGEALSAEKFPFSQYPKFLEDRNGTSWFLGWNVMSAYDASAHRFRHYMIFNGKLLPNERWREREEFRISAARKDPDGSFWLAVYQEGVFHFDPITLQLKGFSHDENDTTSLSNNRTLAMVEDPSEPERFFWVGTEGGGVNKFEKATGRCSHVTTRNGMPNNVVYTVFADKNGKLWMSTNSGLCSLDPKTMTFKYYDVQDGLQGMEFNRERNFQAPDGRIYLEGTQGVNVFYPEEIMENSHIPQLVFTDLKIHGKSVSWKDADSPLKMSITTSKEIVLPYDQNILTFEFAALDFSNSGSNEYSYRLEGYSDEWTKPSKEHTATFTSLSPGAYTLHVRGSNNDAIWNEAGVSLSLIILPPWYRTWWAYSGYIALIITALYLFRRYDLKRIRLKDQLELANVKTSQLKEVDQLKMQFFQNISHEFRTPLTLILGPIEKLMNGTELAEPQKRDVRMMRRNAQKLLRLINQLLDISKIEAGGMKLQASKGNFVSFIRGITMSFHSLAERKEIFFDVHAVDENVEIHFDKEKMEKIITNLLSNAFKFTPDHGEIVVTLSPTPLPKEEGQGVMVSVRDTGIGIPPEKLPHIFDRFYQVDSTSTRMQEGTGIGLALVKDLVALHHGTITVTSEPGKGSEFIVTLPIGKSHLKPEEIVDEPTTNITPVLPTFEEESGVLSELGERETLRFAQVDNSEDKPILLVIEDNTDVREYIKTYLLPIYTVLEARDGAEGIEKAKETIPDLIISDVMMPKMDGYEVCSKLKQDEKTSHVPIILLTAKASKEDKIGGLETGADDYLIKPFDSAELLVRVKNLIESRKKLREKFGKELVTLKPAEVAVTSVDQVFLTKVIEAIEKQMGDEQFGVNELANAIGLSSKQLQRKLKGLANTTASDFIRSFRLQRAKELLLKDSTTIAEVAYSVGFSSPAYFTKCFSEQFGMTPSEMRKADL